jgi:hypothetical protein
MACAVGRRSSRAASDRSTGLVWRSRFGGWRTVGISHFRRAAPTDRSRARCLRPTCDSFADERGLLFTRAFLSGARLRGRKRACDFCLHFPPISVVPFVSAHGLERCRVGVDQRSHDGLRVEGVVAGQGFAYRQPAAAC